MMSIENQSMRELQDKVRELEMVFMLSNDEIFLADANGYCIRVNPACERNYNVKGIDLIGHNVSEMEKEKIFYPSATSRVIKELRPVTLIQSTASGRKLYVNANPVFDSEGNLVSVVSNSTDITEILSLKKKVGELERLVEEYNKKLNLELYDLMETKSTSMSKIFELLKRVAPVDTNILLLGETGVGKTEIAKCIHKLSARKQGPFVEINCAAIPPNLFESELFGYERGSFTGALNSGKVGLIESANQGTVFLDEIGELPLELQIKLLQVIQSKSFMRVGGRELIKMDVRFITATNQDIQLLADEGKFRKDLYYRLNIVTVKIPPLRERKEDLIDLIFSLLDRVNKKYNLNKSLSPHLINEFLNYEWPGNIRELENTIERLAVTVEGEVIKSNESFFRQHAKIIPSAEAAPHNFINHLVENSELELDDMLSFFEQEVLTHFMKKMKSSRRVAERLGVSQSTIIRKMQKYKKD